jgi:hypothetical protein
MEDQASLWEKSMNLEKNTKNSLPAQLAMINKNGLWAVDRSK